MRLKIRLDVRKPLKRRKKICKKDKTEIMVNYKYEKLGDFCFVCGMLSHTKRVCQKKLEAGAEEIVKDWGPSLRAQPRRMTGGNLSKWLREDGDGDWGRQLGVDNSKAGHQGFQNRNSPRVDLSARVNRDNTFVFMDISGKSTSRVTNLENKEGNLNGNEADGLDSKEQYGLNLEDRKRQRSETYVNAAQVKNQNISNKESTLSDADCVGTSSTFLVKPVKQASQQQ